MGNLEKLDALKELLNDWSIIGMDENDHYFTNYSKFAKTLQNINVSEIYIFKAFSEIIVSK
jgi:hypothetical protein